MFRTRFTSLQNRSKALAFALAAVLLGVVSTVSAQTTIATPDDVDMSMLGLSVDTFVDKLLAVGVLAGILITIGFVVMQVRSGRKGKVGV